MTDTVNKLEVLEMPNLARLYKTLKKPKKFGLPEMGSSSIDPDYVMTCSVVRGHMKDRHGIVQTNEQFNRGWETSQIMPSAVFYFGGYAMNTDQEDPFWIEPVSYIIILASTVNELDVNVRTKFDELCSCFLKVTEIIARKYST